MDDRELDDNEEQQIEHQLEQEEQPEIKQIKNDISDDNFYIDRNGQKIKFYDPDERHFKKQIILIYLQGASAIAACF